MNNILSNPLSNQAMSLVYQSLDHQYQVMYNVCHCHIDLYEFGHFSLHHEKKKNM